MRKIKTKLKFDHYPHRHNNHRAYPHKGYLKHIGFSPEFSMALEHNCKNILHVELVDSHAHIAPYLIVPFQEFHES